MAQSFQWDTCTHFQWDSALVPHLPSPAVTKSPQDRYYFPPKQSDWSEPRRSALNSAFRSSLEKFQICTLPPQSPFASVLLLLPATYAAVLHPLQLSSGYNLYQRRNARYSCKLDNVLIIKCRLFSRLHLHATAWSEPLVHQGISIKQEQFSLANQLLLSQQAESWATCIALDWSGRESLLAQVRQRDPEEQVPRGFLSWGSRESARHDPAASNCYLNSFSVAYRWFTSKAGAAER